MRILSLLLLIMLWVSGCSGPIPLAEAEPPTASSTTSAPPKANPTTAASELIQGPFAPSDLVCGPGFGRLQS